MFESIANRIGYESVTGSSPAEAAWRFFANNPNTRSVPVQVWKKTSMGSEFVRSENWTRADVRRAIPGSLQTC